LQWPIRDAVEIDDKIIVLLDPNAYLKDPSFEKGSDFRNLIAFSKEGKKLWEAEYPQLEDYYYEIESKYPLRVYSFSSYDCIIDEKTGQIISMEFFK
jgi:hypothetical protein